MPEIELLRGAIPEWALRERRAGDGDGYSVGEPFSGDGDGRGVAYGLTSFDGAGLGFEAGAADEIGEAGLD